MQPRHSCFVCAALALGVAGLFPPAQAANLGSFHADTACEAYLSKNKKTNPDHVQTRPGTDYPVIQFNRPTDPDYYQIEVPGAKDGTARWVGKACGSFTAQGSAPPPANGDACHIARHADSHVLALSWQPAFCQSHGEKSECGIDDRKAFQARNFTLHGLWPNQKGCGQRQGYYTYCGAVKDKPAGGFCAYPPVELGGPVRAGLGVVMPSVSADSCLERHEWHKHGTCGDWAPDEYFALAIRLDHEFNDSGLARFVGDHIGQSVETAEFFQQVDAALGAGASQKISLGCKKGLLVDVAINLPAPLDPKGDLKTLVAQAEPSPGAGDCGQRFKIDAIGQ
ncbi:ribonuclease T2 family protein [Methylomagnum ishizawai]|uniref:ribonuclease T2 family protein n=1 Tax=Methylomagnum ishizawai TaxID=1760988 RepID=UPI001C31EE66|nr:ribonuclease T [Methylomagnum ishizawai]BBL74009.1 ribonuclease T(2) [Methylomagnum ishizawai]